MCRKVPRRNILLWRTYPKHAIIPSMETWKPVVGYEGVYEISDLGQVKRISGWSDGRKTKPIGILKTGRKKRYATAVLHNKKLGKQKQYPVHRLVLAAFVGPLPYGHEVNHKNGIKRDNRLENLEYVTHSENQLHSYRVLNTPTRPGSKHHNAKITEDEALAIRALHRRGWSGKKLAQEFGIGPSTVCWIVKRKAWKHV